jgi:O-glycosyl hydrolase
MHFPVLATAAAVLPLAARQSTITLAVNQSQKYQTMDGFGFSEAFQRANNIHNLAEPKRSQLVDLLFNTTSGAGFSIVRNGIGSSPNSSNDWMNTIEPSSPGSPAGNATYAWDGKDSGQLWLSQQAVSPLAGWVIGVGG